MLSEKVFQMFIIGSGENLDYSLKNGAGGVIFFSDDILSKSDFKNKIRLIKNISKIQPFLSIDQEGGKVERTQNIHRNKYLSPMFAYKKGEEFLSDQTKMMLEELEDYGINMNFAPCLDVNSNPDNPIIGERAFSDNPDDVCKGYDIVTSVYKNFPIIPVIKHFPGHGDTAADSHNELPTVNLDFNKMFEIHIKPFKHAIERGADAVMVAHLHCPCFDKNIIPTSLSKNCIDYLRKDLNFDGVVVSDDMYMKGVSDFGMNEACKMGIMSGLNLFIYRNSSDETLSVIDFIIKSAEKDLSLREKIYESYERIISLKRKYCIID